MDQAKASYLQKMAGEIQHLKREKDALENAIIDLDRKLDLLAEAHRTLAAAWRSDL